MEEKTEYAILNCEDCRKPVVKLHQELLSRICSALHYEGRETPHFYHLECKGGFESKEEMKSIDCAVRLEELKEDDYVCPMLSMQMIAQCGKFVLCIKKKCQLYDPDNDCALFLMHDRGRSGRA